MLDSSKENKLKLSISSNLTKLLRIFLIIIMLGVSFVSFSSLKAETKPLIKVILLDEEVGKIPNYIAKKEAEGYIVEEEKVSNVGNIPIQMKNYIKSQKFKKPNLKYVIIPLNYLSYMRRYLSNCICCGKVHFRGLSDGYYCNTDDDSNEIPEVFLSRANAEILNIQRKKLPENYVTLACPITSFKSFAYRDKWENDYYIYKTDYSKECQNIKNLVNDLSIKSLTLFETDGFDPCQCKPDLSLNTENFIQCYPKTTFIICKSSYEIIEYYKDQDYGHYANIGSQDIYQRSIWIKDKNKNGLAETSEKKTETIIDFDVLPSHINESDWYVDRIGFTDLKEFDYMTNLEYLNKLFSGYISFLPSNVYENTISYYLENYKDLCSDAVKTWKWRLNHHKVLCYHYYGEDYDWFNEPIQNLLKGYSISESIWMNYWFGTVYGDPTKSLSNIALQPKMTLTPKELQNSNASLSFLIHQDEIEIAITNTGEGILNYSFEFNNTLLDILPNKNSLESGREEKITIKLVEKNNFIMNTLLKSKQTTITINSNAGERKIVVKWMGL